MDKNKRFYCFGFIVWTFIYIQNFSNMLHAGGLALTIAWYFIMLGIVGAVIFLITTAVDWALEQ